MTSSGGGPVAGDHDATAPQEPPEAVTARDAETLPSVSVVVPAFRHPERLRTCLEALARQDLPRDRLEVVVVDDGSPQPLAPTASDFETRLDVRVLRQANAGPASARNAGAAAASGDLLAFTDDDCEPLPTWARTLAAAHARCPEALLGGDVVNALPGQLFAETSQLLVSYLYDWYGQRRGGSFFASNNLAVPRAGFAEVGGFDTGFPTPGGEDRELCERWAGDGRPLLRVREALVRHSHRMGLRGFVRQHVTYGRGAWDAHRRRLARTGRSLDVEPASFYLGMLTCPFRHAPPARAAAMSSALVLSQAAGAAGYALARRDHRRHAEDPTRTRHG
ncbi:glycosyltransferase [Pseudokineococcus sp. 1T1Z-3]|uniref:glycosyltransferase n=1 Tax=Pseudokineococcus sp. 1T1Z-3 TaxID=3132745 RepID=UPI00309CBDC6